MIAVWEASPGRRKKQSERMTKRNLAEHAARRDKKRKEISEKAASRAKRPKQSEEMEARRGRTSEEEEGRELGTISEDTLDENDDDDTQACTEATAAGAGTSSAAGRT